MTDIFPAEGQSVGEVITELAGLGLVQDQDFRLHWTWDMRPYVKAEPAAYKKWQKEHGGDEEAAKSSSDTKTGKSTSDSDDDDGKGSSTTRKRGGK